MTHLEGSHYIAKFCYSKLWFKKILVKLAFFFLWFLWAQMGWAKGRQGCPAESNFSVQEGHKNMMSIESVWVILYKYSAYVLRIYQFFTYYDQQHPEFSCSIPQGLFDWFRGKSIYQLHMWCFDIYWFRGKSIYQKITYVTDRIYSCEEGLLPHL